MFVADTILNTGPVETTVTTLPLAEAVTPAIEPVKAVAIAVAVSAVELPMEIKPVVMVDVANVPVMANVMVPLAVDVAPPTVMVVDVGAVAALPTLPSCVEPLHNVRLENDALLPEETESRTVTWVIFTSSLFEVSVKRKIARLLPGAPITIWPVGAWVVSAETATFAVPAIVAPWPGWLPQVIALNDVTPVPEQLVRVVAEGVELTALERTSAKTSTFSEPPAGTVNGVPENEYVPVAATTPCVVPNCVPFTKTFKFWKLAAGLPIKSVKVFTVTPLADEAVKL